MCISGTVYSLQAMPRAGQSEDEKTMSPDRKFSLCLRTLECYFDMIYRNIFRDVGNNFIGFMAVSIFLVVCLSMFGYTIAIYDRDTVIGAVIIFCGDCQVWMSD